jgi:VanZ family protein
MSILPMTRPRNYSILAAIFWLASTAWMALVWHWSSLPGEASPLRETITTSSTIFAGHYDGLAHFCVFGLLAFFLHQFLAYLGIKYPIQTTFSLAWCYAFIDELHQHLAGHGRIFSLTDLLADTAGIITMLTLIFAFSRIRDHWKIVN